MKKILLFLFTCLNLGAIAQSELSREINKLYDGNFYDTFTGSLEAKQTNPQSLVVTIGTASSEVHDRAFVLMAESPRSFPVFQSAKSTLFINQSQRFVIVIDEVSDRVYILGLDEEATNVEIEKLKSNETIGSHFATAFLSYSQSYVTGSWRIESLEKSNYKSPYNYLSSGDITGKFGYNAAEELNGGTGGLCDQGACTSGGAGSETCEIVEDYVGVKQTCKVQCKSGYYSCCTSKTTRCYCCKEN